MDASVIAQETTLLGALELKAMRLKDFGAVLGYVEYFCQIELMYHTDLRRVQRNLNDLPHASGVPASKVSELMQRGARYLLH